MSFSPDGRIFLKKKKEGELGLSLSGPSGKQCPPEQILETPPGPPLLFFQTAAEKTLFGRDTVFIKNNKISLNGWDRDFFNEAVNLP